MDAVGGNWGQLGVIGVFLCALWALRLTFPPLCHRTHWKPFWYQLWVIVVKAQLVHNPSFRSIY